MKNRELIIGTIVILIIIIIVLILGLYYCLNGNFKLKKWGTKKSSMIIFDTTYEATEIANLEVLSIAGDIKFEESIDGKVRVVAYGENEEDLTVDLNENRLKVDYSKYKQRNVFFGFHFYCNDITIYIPKNYAGEIAVRANYGDIEAIDLANSAMNIEADCGDVILGKIKNVTVKNDYGDVKIEQILNQATIELSCGDVKINELNVVEDSSIVNNFGDIKIGQTNEVYIDAKTDFGDVKVNQNHRHSEITLKLQNDCGDIKVDN